jgi:hypothetical protein
VENLDEIDEHAVKHVLTDSPTLAGWRPVFAGENQNKKQDPAS